MKSQLENDKQLSARQILLDTLGGKCKFCGSTERLRLHHKDGNRRNNASSNIQILCTSCHYTLHKNSHRKLNSRPLVQVTIAEDVVATIKHILQAEIKWSEKTDRLKPSFSGVVEMLLRKGIKSYEVEENHKRN